MTREKLGTTVLDLVITHKNSSRLIKNVSVVRRRRVVGHPLPTV